MTEDKDQEKEKKEVKMTEDENVEDSEAVVEDSEGREMYATAQLNKSEAASDDDSEEDEDKSD